MIEVGQSYSSHKICNLSAFVYRFILLFIFVKLCGYLTCLCNLHQFSETDTTKSQKHILMCISMKGTDPKCQHLFFLLDYSCLKFGYP